MTTPTYSQSVSGYVSGPVLGTQATKIPDTGMDGSASATTGGLASVMQTGDQILCKGPDGALHWYKIDAERSLPGITYLIYVGP